MPYDLDDYAERTLYALSREPAAIRREAEHMGVVYEDAAGNLGRMPFVQLGAIGGQASVSIPKDARLRAIVHNHPDTHKKALLGALSPEDVAAAEQLNTPMYVLSQGGAGYGETVKFQPGVTRKGRGGAATPGDKVLAEYPMEAIPARMRIAELLK